MYRTISYTHEDLKDMLPSDIWEKARALPENHYLTIEATDKKTQRIAFFVLIQSQAKVRVGAFQNSADRDTYIKSQNLGPARMHPPVQISLCSYGNNLDPSTFTLYNQQDPQTNQTIYYIILKNVDETVEYHGYSSAERRARHLQETHMQGFTEHSK